MHVGVGRELALRQMDFSGSANAFPPHAGIHICQSLNLDDDDGDVEMHAGEWQMDGCTFI